MVVNRQHHSHAYLLAAEAEQGYEIAKQMAQAILCEQIGPEETQPCGTCRACRKALSGQHPDIITVSRQTDDKGKAKREIYVEQVREISASAFILPNESETKIYIMRDAGTMNAAAQNAFLKLLEEPPPFDVFLLIADYEEQLLETVRSRCVTRRENREELATDPAMRDLAELYLNVAANGKRLPLLRYCAERGDLSNAEGLEFARTVRLLLSDMLCGRLPDRHLSRPRLIELDALMVRTEGYLRQNVSMKHVFGMLAAETL